MIEENLIIKEIVEKWSATRRRVQPLCSEGWILGATRFGNERAISADAKRPTDARITTDEYCNLKKISKK